MAEDADIRQEILNKTLQEVAREDEDGSTKPCVICLEVISEAAVALPCKHDNFDFLCLASWLQHRRVCPLCKTDLTAIRYDLQSPEGPKLFVLPPQTEESVVPIPHYQSRALPSSNRFPERRRFHHRASHALDPQDSLARRRRVYRNQTYSLRVGSNRLSQYRELTPEMFNRDDNLISRARKFIRRELRVFEFLNPEVTEEQQQQQRSRPRPGQQRLQNRRANNAEFLLEYVIAILRTVDIKGSTGQAEELLQEFIGRANARLFLHELNSWLRSPYNSLEDWDRHVQYREASHRAASRYADAAQDRNTTPLDRRARSGSPLDESERGRFQKRRRQAERSQPRQNDSAASMRRLYRARQRYQPD